MNYFNQRDKENVKTLCLFAVEFLILFFLHTIVSPEFKNITDFIYFNLIIFCLSFYFFCISLIVSLYKVENTNHIFDYLTFYNILSYNNKFLRWELVTFFIINYNFFKEFFQNVDKIHKIIGIQSELNIFYFTSFIHICLNLMFFFTIVLKIRKVLKLCCPCFTIP